MTGMNPSGIEPIEYNVLVKPEEVAEKTSGGLFKPQDLREREQWAETRGVLVAASPIAFNFESDAPKPSVGDVVMFKRHSGTLTKGADGVEYRIVSDKDIIGVMRHGR